MVETQVTTMVIKVIDLGCEKCHKKIKKVLCGIPQIQNQTYDQKKNTVTITVVGCCPEKIKKKIYCKGEGQSVIYGEMDVVVAEVGVTMCAEVHMFMKTIPRHAKSCEGKVQKTDGLSQRPASTIGFKSSVLLFVSKNPSPIHQFSSHFLPEEMPRNNIIRPYFGNVDALSRSPPKITGFGH
ncbi:hypothetical protein NC653_015394 [Populus alba x Populus x berolinensis]|uniref:HMA domain-containing protein n=1 Tax=Populus alba x Populus x berolinensis TaxID=444605 RepID=A0AAD6QKI7_9ROSI|nr:hypothetical protein NC653_015394 [Populus alba x Populus x berolinensis]